MGEIKTNSTQFIQGYQAAATGTLKRSREELPTTSEGRGSGRKCQTATAQERPRGATPRPRSGAATRGLPTEVRGGGREEIPHALKPKARGGGQEDQTHAVAVRAQEGLAELSHVEGQEGRW